MLQLHVDDAGAHRGLESRMVLLGLVGIGERELAHCVVALAYADQAERDHAALKAAVRAGIVEVQLER